MEGGGVGQLAAGVGAKQKHLSARCVASRANSRREVWKDDIVLQTIRKIWSSSPSFPSHHHKQRRKPEQSFGSVRRSDREVAPEDKNVKTNSVFFAPEREKKKTRLEANHSFSDTRPVCRTRKTKPNTSWESFVMLECLPKQCFPPF